MKQSQLFTKTRREAPKDEVAKNAQLLIRAGYIHKEMAGVYSYLPLGLRVLRKIEQIIREAMDNSGAQEVQMTALQDPTIWKDANNRWDDNVVDNWFKTKLANDTQLGLGFSHEEPLVRILKGHLNSYKDFPLAVYQIQAKFRNELRSKSGIMRGREFMMKDLYSFHLSEEDFTEYYEKMAGIYLDVFKEVGLGDTTVRTKASGGSFSKFSDEFQTFSDAGEDTIYLCQSCSIAINDEIIAEQDSCPDCGAAKDKLETKKSIEVGNIFPLKAKFTEAGGLKVSDAEGTEKQILMGCYGIGVSRLMGTIVEVLSDDQGIVWPKNIAPFAVHLVELGGEQNADVRKDAEALYAELNDAGIEVLYDDRDRKPGEKFADSDLMGMPYRVVVSAKTLESGTYELKERQSGEVKMVSKDDLMKAIQG